MRLRAVLGAVSWLALSAAAAHAQSSLLQGGPFASGRAPMYSTGGQSQPIVQDSGPSSGGAVGVGLSELGITSRPGNGVNIAPYANNGNGPLGEHACMFDAPTTNPTGYHYICFDPNAQGGGLIDYGYGGGATPLPLHFSFNGAIYSFPFSSAGGIVGPSVSGISDHACWNNTTGSLLADCGEPVLPLQAGTSSGAEATNAALINSAIAAASAAALATSPVNAQTIILPAGDFYFSSTLIPQSGVTIRSAGLTTLHYTAGGHAVENSNSVPIKNFIWDYVALDSAAGTAGVVLHSPWANVWHFAQVSAANASATFFQLLADINGNGSVNTNAAFNVVDGLYFTLDSYVGTPFYISGTSFTPTPAIATLNTIGDIYAPDVRVGGVNIYHWADTNTFQGQQNLVVNANNAFCLNFNSSGDTVKTVYNTTMQHVSCNQYASFTGTTAVVLGYTRTVNINALYFDENSGSQFGHLLSINSTGTSSYRIVVHGNDPFGSEKIVVWQQYNEFSGGNGVALAQSLPITWSQAWNNAAVAFTAYNFDVTDTASLSTSLIANYSNGGVSKFYIDKNGNFGTAGAGNIAGALAVTGQSALNGGVNTSYLGLGNPLLIGTAPTIISGFGTSPSITWSNGSAVFDLTVGSGGAASTGVVGLNAAAVDAWTCTANDITTTSSTVFMTKQTASAASSATFTNYNTSGAAAAWTAGDHLRISCQAG